MGNMQGKLRSLFCSDSWTGHLKQLNMLARSVFIDIQNNIIVNISRPKLEKCNYSKHITNGCVAWNKVKESFISFRAEPGWLVTAVLLITLV